MARSGGVQVEGRLVIHIIVRIALSTRPPASYSPTLGDTLKVPVEGDTDPMNRHSSVPPFMTEIKTGPLEAQPFGRDDLKVRWVLVFKLWRVNSHFAPRVEGRSRSLP